MYSLDSNITIEASISEKNLAFYGGVIYSVGHCVALRGSVFRDNCAIKKGGVLHSRSSDISIEASEFGNNTVNSDREVLDSTFNTIKIIEEEELLFAVHNYIIDLGGVLNFIYISMS